MKRTLMVIALALICLTAVFAQGNAETAQKSESNKLILITATSTDNLNAVIPAFEEKYGIKVEIITGSTGEVMARIKAEKDNPSCDVTWVGEYQALTDQSLFETYVASTDKEYPEIYKNKSGVFTAINGTCPVIVWNTTMVPNGIKGYKDLLDPALKGKIAFGDAGTSSSAYNHLENMLLDFGNGDIDAKAGWDYVEALLKQLDGRVVNSSAATYKGVVSGEYAVGLAWDAPALQLVASNTPNVDFCYMSEGAASKLSGISIIKGAKNVENAKLLADFLSSKEGQALLAEKSAGACPVRTDVELPASKAIMKTANIFAVDSVWSAGVKKSVQTKFTDLLTTIVK